MTLKLTQTVQKGGCAAKISAETLRSILGAIDLSNHDPRVMIDGKDFDDAGIYQINEEVALVQTLDFFTPVVDTPFLFGQIAAVNALSDVYAMGGAPKTAMAILAFPTSTLDPTVMKEILEGAMNKVREAHCSLLGGHSIDDDSLKFGLSVTGTVHPKAIWSNSGARPGDQLILTKPIGTGTLCAGLKNGDYSENDIRDALDSMIALNQIRDLLTSDELKCIHAATDITGFGLAGHGYQLARASEASLAISLGTIPLFEKTLASIKAENLTRAHRTNRAYTEQHLGISSPVDPHLFLTAFDPQTSGGLLLSVAPESAGSILSKIQKRFGRASCIGQVTAKQERDLLFHD